MTLLTYLGVTCINTNELERSTRAESTSPRVVSAMLVPERAPAQRRAVLQISLEHARIELTKIDTTAVRGMPS